MKTDLKKLEKATKTFTKKNALCPKCGGVRCLPKNFGMGNPNAKPCYYCRGRGWLPSKHSK